MARRDIQLNSAQLRAILKSRQVEAVCKRIADRVAEAAGDGFVARSSVGRNRARAAVIAASPRARRGQAKDGRLLRALGGGRVRG